MYSYNCFLMLVDKVKALLKLLDDVQPCFGNSDNHFLSLTNIHKGIMLDKSSKCISVCNCLSYLYVHSSVVYYSLCMLTVLIRCLHS